jgi:small neutral amino acid transporter SnatA (MarC family)
MAARGVPRASRESMDMTQLADQNPEQRKRVLITAVIIGAIALAFFISAFFALGK